VNIVRYLLSRISSLVFGLLGLKIEKAKNDRSDLNVIYRELFEANDQLVIFDVGANVGQSVWRFKRLFRNSSVHSFEPIGENVKQIKTRYSGDENLIVNQTAVGEYQGRETLLEYANNAHSSFHRLLPDTIWLKKRSRQKRESPGTYKKKETPVDVITLDSYCEDKGIEGIDILKIDTQGYEDKVLNGSKGLLRKGGVKLVELELIFSPIYERVANFSDIEKNLVNNGYRLVGLNTPGNLARDYIWQSDVVYARDDIFKKLTG